MYCLSVTINGADFTILNVFLLFTALGIGVLFIQIQKTTNKPLIDLSIFQDIELNKSLIINALVSTVMMATLVVGPFYLSFSLKLNESTIGLVMAFGPVISFLTGIPSGYLVDQWGNRKIVFVGLILLAIGAILLAALPRMWGIFGYITAIAILTPGYQLFQAANNTSVLMDVGIKKRGVISGILTLSRNLGLITGASVMGALFVFFSEQNRRSLPSLSSAESASRGMTFTFLFAACLMVFALFTLFFRKRYPKTQSK